LFLAAATLGGVSGGVTNLLLNLYIVALGYPESALPGFTRFGLAGAAAGALAGGPVVDTLGPRRSMLAGTAFAAAGALLVLLAIGPLALGAGMLLTSAGTVLVYVAAPPFLTRHSTPSERQYLFGVVAAAYVVSTATGAALGGALPPLLRVSAPGLPDASVYRLALLAGGLLSALGIPLLAMTGEAPAAAMVDKAGASRASGVFSPAALVELVRSRLLDRRFVILVGQFVLADGLIRVGGNLVIPYMNVYFVRHLGAPEAVYGTLRFAERALVVIATLVVALPVTRFGPVATIVVTQLLSVPMLLVLGFAPTLGIAAASFLVRGPLMEMTQPTRDSFLMEVVPADRRATAFAALTLAGYAIAFAASFLAERLLRAGRFDVAFALTGALYVTSAILYWLFFRRVPQAAPHRQPDLAAVAAEAVG
jgi:MFS family permease